MTPPLVLLYTPLQPTATDTDPRPPHPTISAHAHLDAARRVLSVLQHRRGRLLAARALGEETAGAPRRARARRGAGSLLLPRVVVAVLLLGVLLVCVGCNRGLNKALDGREMP